MKAIPLHTPRKFPAWLNSEGSPLIKGERNEHNTVTSQQ